MISHTEKETGILISFQKRLIYPHTIVFHHLAYRYMVVV